VLDFIGGPNGIRTRVLALRGRLGRNLQVLENTGNALQIERLPAFIFSISFDSFIIFFDAFISRFLHGISTMSRKWYFMIFYKML